MDMSVGRQAAPALGTRSADGAPLPSSVEAWSRHINSRVHPGRLRAGLVAGTLPVALRAGARASAGRPAIELGGRRLTHAELDARVERVGGWLRARGIDPGDRVVVAGPVTPDLVTAYLGIVRARAVMVPADPEATHDALRSLVADSGAVAAFASGAARERLEGLGLRIVAGLDGGDAPSVDDAVEAGAPLAVESRSDDVVMLAYTSGATGRPKGVPLSHAHVLASLRGAMWAWRWGPGDSVVHVPPLSLQHSLWGIQIGLLSGAGTVLLERSDPERVCAAVASGEATIVFAGPAAYERLAAWEGLAPAVAAGSTRLWLSGGAPLPACVASRAAEVLGEPPLEWYGTTESGLSVSAPYAGIRRGGAVGLALPGLEVAVVDESGAYVEPGTDGEVVLRGPQVFGGYWHRRATDARSFVVGGWFRTGDRGRIAAQDEHLELALLRNNCNMINVS